MSPSEQMPPGAKGGAGSHYPGFIEPALATTKDAPPSGSQWLHELKLDGYRIQAHIWDGELKFFTRSGLDWTARMGAALANAFRSLGVHEAIIDGELVVEGENSIPEFGALQDALAKGRGEALRYFAFDLLFLGGLDLRSLPLIERKEALRAIITGTRCCALQRALPGGRPDFPAPCLPARCRGRRVQKERCSLSIRTHQPMGEGEMLPAAGICHRRLCAINDRGQGHGIIGARLLPKWQIDPRRPGWHGLQR
jgi:hypothetical protein